MRVRVGQLEFRCSHSFGACRVCVWPSLWGDTIVGSAHAGMTRLAQTGHGHRVASVMIWYVRRCVCVNTLDTVLHTSFVHPLREI